MVNDRLGGKSGGGGGGQSSGGGKKVVRCIIITCYYHTDVFAGLSVAGPTAWNNLPASIRSLKSTDSFKRQLKTHLFRLAYTVGLVRMFYLLSNFYF